MKHILYCKKCEEYTMGQKCSRCGEKSVSRIPAKFSPEDTIGDYRRTARRQILEKEGLL